MTTKSPPPAQHRFKPGTSGNPRGRPKGSKNKRTRMRTPALDEIVRVPVDGVLRRMPLREAIVRFAEVKAFKTKDTRLMARLLERDQKLRDAEVHARLNHDRVKVVHQEGISWSVSSIEAAVRRLGLGKLIHPGHPTQRIALTPEIVSLALSHMGDRRLDRDTQKLVLSFTLTPHKVDWPGWWEPDLRKAKCRVPERFFKADDAEWLRALTPPTPTPYTPPPIDLEAEWERERRQWLCKYTRQHPSTRCADCIRVKPKKAIECPHA